MDIIERIRTLMEAKGYSEYRLAKESSLHQSTVANIFHRQTIPSITTLSAICNALDISLSQFFDDSSAVSSLRIDQKKLLADWDKLTNSQKDILNKLIDELISPQKI